VKLLVALAILVGIWWLAQRKKAATSLTPAEARAILEVGAEAGTQEIVEAHRRLIAKVHPDAGGSAALAARVNAAREVLLTGRERKSVD
jgi:DnaJ-class molecular chaperone